MKENEKKYADGVTAKMQKDDDTQVNCGPRRTKIIIRRTFGNHDLMDLYTDYIADKLLASGTCSAVRA